MLYFVLRLFASWVICHTLHIDSIAPDQSYTSVKSDLAPVPQKYFSLLSHSTQLNVTSVVQKWSLCHMRTV